MKREIWIWQNVLSPHMAPIAAALAERGHKVKYIAQKESLEERTDLGWNIPTLGAAELVKCSTPATLRALAERAGPDVEHVFQGFRGNGSLSEAFRVLSRRRILFWVFMESIDDRGLKGFVRRVYYRCVFTRWRGSLKGVLAVGAGMSEWLSACGVKDTRIVPFSYFLAEPPPEHGVVRCSSDTFRIMFVGKLTGRKGVDVLLYALSDPKVAVEPFELTIIGVGPELEWLQTLSQRIGLQHSVKWLGRRAIDEIPGLMREADLFVLPSRYDGWGAVVTEALMAGTPTITTNRCGASEAVRASGCGAVVPVENTGALSKAITAAIELGPVEGQFRSDLSHWALAFGARQGAAYLSAIFDAASEGMPPPPPPWLTTQPPERKKSA